MYDIKRNRHDVHRNRTGFKKAARVGHWNMLRLDETLKSEARKKKGMSKSQFRRKLMGDLGHENVPD